MKKMISMISVAVLAVVFAAGCGGDDAKGSKASGSHGSTDSVAAAAAAGKKICEAANANQTACDAATATLADKATHGCKFTAGTPAKCEYVDGATLVGHAASLAKDEATCKAETDKNKCVDHSAQLVNKAAKKCVENTGTDKATVKCMLDNV